jgi:hypothetical protein
LKQALIFVALTAAFSLSHAADDQSRPPGGNERNPAIEAAMKECGATATKDANGRPDRAAMESCMTAKGFPRPAHREGQEGRPPKGEKGDMPAKN